MAAMVEISSRAYAHARVLCCMTGANIHHQAPPSPSSPLFFDLSSAMKWLATVGGQCSEADYPYTSGGGNTGSCKKTCTAAVKVTGGVEVAKHNETALQAAIYRAPLSLSVDASSNDWQLYAGGVYDASCKCKSESCLDHGVGGVGWGVTASGEEYWIVKVRDRARDCIFARW